MSNPVIVPPVRPYRGTRANDAWGSGLFLASRDGGSRKHLGRDFVSVPGDEIPAVFKGRTSRAGFAYPDGKLHSLWLEGQDEWEGWRAQYLYVALSADAIVGIDFQQGETVAFAEDVAAYYAAKDPTRKMTNHVHLMLIGPVDPGIYLPTDLVIKKDLTA